VRLPKGGIVPILKIAGGIVLGIIVLIAGCAVLLSVAINEATKPQESVRSQALDIASGGIGRSSEALLEIGAAAVAEG
jgi:hypothetical protein